MGSQRPFEAKSNFFATSSDLTDITHTSQQDGSGRPTTVLPALERFPDQHGVVVQAPEGRKVIHRRHAGLRRPDLQGPQDGPVGVLALLQGPPGGEPGQAPHHYSQGRPLPAPHRHPRVHVRWRSQRRPRSTPSFPQDGGTTQSERPGRGAANHQTRIMSQATAASVHGKKILFYCYIHHNVHIQSSPSFPRI